jgi:hypothetical protein
MKRIQILGAALLSVVAFSAVATTAAHAEKGPFWQICQKQTSKTFEFTEKLCKTKSATKEGEWELKRLLEKETAGISAKAKTEFKLASATVNITCKALKLEAGAVLVGSTGANFGSSKEVVVFENCTVTGNGEPCEVEGKKVTTKPILNQLEFEKGELKAGEGILVHFKPEKGTAFAEPKFTGAGCKAKSILVEGTVGAEAWQKGKLVTVGSEALEVVNELNFPNPALAKGFLEEAGVKKEIKLGLNITGGLKATLTGTSEVVLTNGEAWGPFTK